MWAYTNIRAVQERQSSRFSGCPQSLELANPEGMNLAGSGWVRAIRGATSVRWSALETSRTSNMNSDPVIGRVLLDNHEAAVPVLVKFDLKWS